MTREWMLVTVGLVALLAVTGIVTSFMALGSRSSTTTTIVRQASAARHSTAASAGASATSIRPTTAQLGSGAAQSGAAAVVPIVLQKDASKSMTGTITGRDGWPRYSPSRITIPAGKRVTLVITNYDDMNTPLAAGTPYNKVQGGHETVDGKPVTFVSNKMIAHTFTIPTLGINVPIPMATMGGSSTITFTFSGPKSGTYTWQCYTPCGSGKSGTGGQMVTNGYMQGEVIVA